MTIYNMSEEQYLETELDYNRELTESELERIEEEKMSRGEF